MKIIIACILSFAVSAITGKYLVPKLRALKAGQSIREDGPTWHAGKAGTPTMGGLMFILGIFVAILVCGFPGMLKGDFKHLYIFFFALIFGVIGFLDDYEKVKHQQNLGLTAIQKFLLQLVAAVAFLTLMRFEGMLTPNLYVPFFNTHIILSWPVYMVFAAFVIVGTVNAVNITDGIDGLAGSVTVYDYHAEPMQQKKVTDFAQGKGLSFLNEQDQRKLSKAISRATPEAPDVVLPVMVQRDGKPHLHRMALHTIWSGAGVRRCVNVLGHLTDEQHRVEHQAELLTALDPEEDPAHFLRRLQGIFDVVRLVDPEHRKVLALDSDGILTEKPGNCHMVWNKDTRCENCISAKAYARKTILNKIEFKDEEAYFVISKYIEVGGRGCMLELVTRLTDGRWLDMGGHRLLLDRCNGMERSAFVDPLTGAYTRRYFDKFLAGGEMHGGVAMIDVNQFKSVNDSFGHLVGDEALQTVAAAMQSCLRQTDILIRYGGDEFLLLMPQSRPNGVESVIRRVQDAVQAARVPSHPELRLSVSIGGVCNVQPLTEAIRQADARMYCNKENSEQVL